VRQYTETLSFSGLNVKHIFWYNFHNDGANANTPENNYGLIRSDWRTPKYAYTAYQQMTLHLTGAAPQGRLDTGAGPAYRFTRNGTVVDVVWGNGHATLPTGATVAQAYDLAGNKLPTTVANGHTGDVITPATAIAPVPPVAPIAPINPPVLSAGGVASVNGPAPAIAPTPQPAPAPASGPGYPMPYLAR